MCVCVRRAVQRNFSGLMIEVCAEQITCVCVCDAQNGRQAMNKNAVKSIKSTKASNSTYPRV